MASRSNLEGRVAGKPRRTTVGQDVKDIAAGIGRTVGGLAGRARDNLRDRNRKIDDVVDGSVVGAKGKYQ